MQHVGAAAHREQRQHRLIPQHAPVETPRIQRRKLQRLDFRAAGDEGLGEIALVHADPGRRTDGELRVERDPHGLQCASASRTSAA